jgi:hypothetical protein
MENGTEEHPNYDLGELVVEQDRRHSQYQFYYRNGTDGQRRKYFLRINASRKKRFVPPLISHLIRQTLPVATPPHAGWRTNHRFAGPDDRGCFLCHLDFLPVRIDTWVDPVLRLSWPTTSPGAIAAQSTVSAK